MDYPSLQGKLLMTEYGRNIQQMVAHALTIEDRDERTRCVKSIIQTMGNLFPYLRDVNDFRHKLWDHLAIMSDFKLDIDFPYEKPEENILHTKPESIPYQSNRIVWMHYGRMVQEMIAKAISFPEGDEKNCLIAAIANQMKKNYLLWNKEQVDDAKILEDLRTLSKGVIDLQVEELKLLESREILGKKPHGNVNTSRNNQHGRRFVPRNRKKQ